MRSLAPIALFATCLASPHLFGQSLTEHAAAAAGATIGTAAGKPLGTSLSKIFGSMDDATNKAAGPRATKPAASKPTPVAPSTAPVQAAAPATIVAPGFGGGGEIPGVSGGTTSSHHRRARRAAETSEVAEEPAAPITPVAPVIPPPPPVKEPTADEIAGVKVGATANQLRELLGPPESQVSIPDDDGHLVQICQYWSKGEEVGTIRLDNGRVVSVQAIN